MYARVAWTLTVLTLILVAADVAFTASDTSLLSEHAIAIHGFPFVTAAVLGSAIMGALIITQEGRHPIGWLLCLVGFTSAVSLAAEAFSFWSDSGTGPGPAGLGHVAGWIALLFGGQISIAAIAFMFLVAPDGHFLSRRWRYAAAVPFAGAVSCSAAVLMLSPTTYDVELSNAQGNVVSRLLFTIGMLLIAAGLIASLVSMVRRLRRSGGEARRQLRLVATSAAFITLGLVCLLVVQLFNGGEKTLAASLPLFAAYFCMPILFAVAVLRYRLYEIEVIINRALVLAVATAFAAIGYTGLVVAVGTLVGTRTGGFWPSLLATALVALAFQPLRRSVVRLANRLAFGTRAVPYEALSRFSRELSGTPSPEFLLPAVAEAAGRAVSASSSTAILQVPGSGAVSEVWSGGGSDVMPPYEIPVRLEGQVLGSIEICMPKGRPLRAVDEQLLRGLADQAALAFRNAALKAQLAGHVAALDRTTRELEESRRRIIEADDAARRLLEAAIFRDVLPHLNELPIQLDHVRADIAAAACELDGLVTQTNTALEALRELTRGVFPSQLTRSGIVPALTSYLAKRGLGAALHVDPAVAERRFPPRVEAAVYFCCAEALRGGSNSSKADLTLQGGVLTARVVAVTVGEAGLQAIVDRVEAAGGSMLADAAQVVTMSIPLDDTTAVSPDSMAAVM